MPTGQAAAWKPTSSARPIAHIWTSPPRPRGHSQRSSGDKCRPFLKWQLAVVTQSRWGRLPVARMSKSSCSKSNGAAMCAKAAAKAHTRCCPKRLTHSSTTCKILLRLATISATGLALMIRAALCARRETLQNKNSANSQNSRNETTCATVGFQVAKWMDRQ